MDESRTQTDAATEQRGQTTSEYAVLLALVALVAAAMLTGLATSVVGTLGAAVS